MNICKRTSLYIFYALLAYMPFHIFLSTWIGSSFHILDFAKVAKDGVLLIGAVLAFIPSVTKPWFRQLLKDKLVILILAYAALTLLLAAVKPTAAAAETLGVVYNTRFLLFFLYAALLTRLYSPSHVLKRSVQIVIASGFVVLVFGIIQYTLLPNNIMTHVGYSRANGVLPAFFIDDKPDLERVMSTLRDPNSLGSYLIILGMLAGAIYIRMKDQALKRAALGYGILSLLCLWFTFSRSGLIGFIVGAITLFIASRGKLSRVSKKIITAGLITVIIIALLLAGGLAVFRNSYFVTNVIFHADQSTKLENPNQLRLRFWRESIKRIEKEPLGEGPGRAGLASIKNNIQGTLLNENYYLQIASEVGIIGLALFLSILAICAYRLWAIRTGVIGLGLLAALAGLMVTNFLVHIWSGEAVAFTWWGLAGLVIYRQPKTKKS